MSFLSLPPLQSSSIHQHQLYYYIKTRTSCPFLQLVGAAAEGAVDEGVGGEDEEEEEEEEDDDGDKEEDIEDTEDDTVETAEKKDDPSRWAES